MSESYVEILEGENTQRPAPGARHELICDRLHERVQASIANFAGALLLPRRSQVKLAFASTVCPDLALVAAPTGKLWLAAEVVQSGDHRADTVVKKQMYEEFKLPRLWMVDPRYNNVEIYHASEHGLVLKGILAGKDILTEKLLPEFQIAMTELFDALPPG
jgi:Uma2 family endonuclease